MLHWWVPLEHSSRSVWQENTASRVRKEKGTTPRKTLICLILKINWPNGIVLVYWQGHGPSSPRSQNRNSKCPCHKYGPKVLIQTFCVRSNQLKVKRKSVSFLLLLSEFYCFITNKRINSGNTSESQNRKRDLDFSNLFYK